MLVEFGIVWWSIWLQLCNRIWTLLCRSDQHSSTCTSITWLQHHPHISFYCRDYAHSDHALTSHLCSCMSGNICHTVISGQKTTFRSKCHVSHRKSDNTQSPGRVPNQQLDQHRGEGTGESYLLQVKTGRVTTLSHRQTIWLCWWLHKKQTEAVLPLCWFLVNRCKTGSHR